MRHAKHWMVVGLIVAGLQLSACGQAPASVTEKPQPAEVIEIEGTDLHRVVLTREAAQRLAIQTVAVRDEQVTRKRTVGGQVVGVEQQEAAVGTRWVSGSSADSRIWVRVPLSAGDLNSVDRSQPATILPLSGSADTTGIVAKPGKAPATVDSSADDQALYYVVDSANHGLAPDQRVRVELSLVGSGATRTVVPYSAVIYDLNGETWVYANPEPLAFVREAVTVDYIDGDLAVLAQGLPADTSIVSVGAPELYGTEFGVGH